MIISNTGFSTLPGDCSSQTSDEDDDYYVFYLRQHN